MKKTKYINKLISLAIAIAMIAGILSPANIIQAKAAGTLKPSMAGAEAVYSNVPSQTLIGANGNTVPTLLFNGMIETASSPSGYESEYFYYTKNKVVLDIQNSFNLWVHPHGYAYYRENYNMAPLQLEKWNGTAYVLEEVELSATLPRAYTWKKTFTNHSPGRYRISTTILNGERIEGEWFIERVDTNIPQTPIFSPITTTPTNQNVDVSITYLNDAVSKQYKIGNGEWTAYTAPITMTENNTVYARASNINNVWSNEASLIISNIDKIAPLTPVISVVDSRLTIIPGTDSNSGVKETLYKINNNSWLKYLPPIILADGNYSIEAKTIDNATNVSNLATGIFNIYTEMLKNSSQVIVIAETTRLQTDVDSARTMVNNLPDISEKTGFITRLDILQTSITYALKPLMANGTKAIYSNVPSQTLIGEAGNTVPTLLFNGIIENGSSPVYYESEYFYYTKNIVVLDIQNSFNLWAHPHGFSYYTVNYNSLLLQLEKWNGTSYVLVEVESPATLPGTYKWKKTFTNHGPGRYRISTTVLNGQRIDGEWFIEKADASLAENPILNSSNNGLTKQNVEVSVTYSTNSLNKEYKVGTGEWITYSTPITLTENNIVYARASNIDNVWTDEVSLIISNIDKVAPSTPVISITNNKLMLTQGSDSHSGVKENLIKINDAEWSIYTGVLTLVDGNYIIEAKTSDNAGNVSDSVLEIFDIYTELQNNSSQFVDIAESTKSQTDLDSARTITMNLPESPERTALIARLDALQIEINYTFQIAIATTAIINAETSKNQADVDSARLLVDALRSVDKLSLTLRLDVIVTAPPTSVEVAVNLVVIAEIAKTQIDINNSWDSVALVQDVSIRTSLQERIKVVDTVYKTAVSTLEVATISRTRTNIVSADTKTKAMNVNIPDKVEMVAEVQVLKTEYNTNFATIVNYDTIINQATYYVNTMEKSLSNFNATKAQSYIVQLPDGENKSRLQERLDLAKQRFAKTLTALQEATYWVDKAEITSLDYYINIAQQRITKLVASVDKTALQARLDILK